MSKDKNLPNIISGGRFADERGKVFFVNDFHMDICKRFYQITHDKIEFVRAWQGHKLESKWFYCVKGSFEVKLIKVDSWDNPSKDSEIYHVEIREDKTEVLHIPPGYVNGFRALEKGSSFLIFSDVNLEDSKADDIRFPKDYWDIWK